MYFKIDASDRSTFFLGSSQCKSSQSNALIIWISCFRGKLLSVNLGTIANDLVNWESSPGPMIKGLSFPIISVAICSKIENKTNQIVTFIKQRFPWFEAYYLSYESSPM